MRSVTSDSYRAVIGSADEADSPSSRAARSARENTVVFSNATLADMAARQPKSEYELLGVRGVGEAKARRYGAEFVDCIRDWKPTGIQEDVSAMSGANVLPVSADAFGAISFANLPTLNTGDIIIFNFGSQPVGSVHLVNHLVDAAGRIRYQNMTDDETTLMRTNSGYVYTIPQSVSEALSSDLSVPFYHALTLEYTDAQHIRHTAVAAYMTNAMTQLENPPLPSGGKRAEMLFGFTAA